MWKSKSSRLSYSLVESLPPLSMMNVESLPPLSMMNESIYKRIKVLIKFVCKLPFTFYLYSLIQFFNFRTKIPLRPRKTAIAQTPTPPPPPPSNGHWPFCVTKVGMDVVPYPKPIKGALTIILKSPLKLLITSSYNGQQLVFLENRIIF